LVENYGYHTPPSLYTVTYVGNTNTSGNAPIDASSPYVAGSTVTILGNSGSPVFAKSGYNFDGWNTAADGLGTSYSQGNTFIINANTILYAKWSVVPAVPAPTALSSVGGNQAAYILFTQTGTAGAVTNYEYSTDNGATFRAFTPAQQYSPVEITALSSDGTTPLTNGIEYTVKLKAVNSAGVTSSESDAVTVTPTVTTLELQRNTEWFANFQHVRRQQQVYRVQSRSGDRSVRANQPSHRNQSRVKPTFHHPNMG